MKKLINSKAIMCVLGLLAGPLEFLVMQLVLNNDNSSLWDIFKIFGLGIAFIIIYRIIQFILANIMYKNSRFTDIDDAVELFCLFCGISLAVTWFAVWRLEGEGIVMSIILAIIFIMFQVIFLIPASDGFSDDNRKSERAKREPKNDIKIKRGYIKDKFGNITGTTDTVSYNGRYGSFETTEFKDNMGNVKGRIDKY